MFSSAFEIGSRVTVQKKEYKDFLHKYFIEKKCGNV